MSWAYTINGTSVTPYNTRGNSVIKEREGYFRIRDKFDGEVILIGDDYNLLKNLESTARYKKHTFEAYDNGSLKFTGKFNISDCKFNPIQKTVKFSVSPVDDYASINEGKDIEVNILDGVQGTQVYSELKSWLVFYNILDSGIGGSPPVNYKLYYEKTDIDLGTTFTFDCYIYAKEQIIIGSNVPAPSGWDVDTELGELTIYSREYDDSIYSTPADDEIYLPFDPSDSRPMLSGNDWYEIGTNTLVVGTNYPIEAQYIMIKSNIYNGGNYNEITVRYKAYELSDIINKIITSIDFNGSVKSNLLFTDRNSLDDYVSGRKKYKKLLITKSDFQNPDASEIATSAILTLKNITDFLKLNYNAEWFIDSNGDLRIEHISYDVNTGNIDISSNAMLNTNYSYKNDEIPNRIIFNLSEAWNLDFTKKQIVYGNIPLIEGTDENKQEFSISKFCTDVDGAAQRLNALSSDFILVEADYIEADGIVTTDLGIKKQIGLYSGNEIQNGGLSLANSLYYYHRHEAYKDSFEMNESNENALTLKKVKYQELEFKTDQQLNINKIIDTKIGNGIVQSLKQATTGDKVYKMEVLYD